MPSEFIALNDMITYNSYHNHFAFSDHNQGLDNLMTPIIKS